MADHGRYDDTGFAAPGREDARGRRRGGMFSPGWDRPEYRERARRDFFGGSRSSAWDREGRGGRGWDRDESYFGYDDYHRGLAIDETEQLIASNKVEGTPVYSRDGERLGSIYNFMVDKRSGQVEYAVMAYGGFLGLGQRYYPLPWRILSYDTREGGYRIPMREGDLERAPSFGREDEPRFNRDYGRRVHNWYGLDY
jgi:hypothetical protein